ncbi:MAG TPA: hypothetical protein VKE51_16935 [Vicinamibacterales bacterium]|nr:hypothetical protein [Vicinamibacterales bacterium]
MQPEEGRRQCFPSVLLQPLGHLSFECARTDDFEHHTNSWIERWIKDDEIAGTCRSS